MTLTDLRQQTMPYMIDWGKADPAKEVYIGRLLDSCLAKIQSMTTRPCHVAWGFERLSKEGMRP